MKNHLHRRGLFFIAVRCLFYLLLLILQPLSVYATELVYTIQVSSLKEMYRATKEYDFLIDTLNEEDLKYLRVEKISQYYSVRLGKFATRMDAVKMNQSIQRYHPSAFIMKAYIKDERIISLYPRTEAGNENTLSSEPSSIGIPEIPAANSPDNKKKKNDSHADIQKGDMYIKDGRMVSAAESYWDAMREDPDNPVLMSKLANTFRKLGMWDQAIMQMKEAVDNSSDNNPTFRVALGKLYLIAGRPIKAKEQFLTAIKMNPGSADSHYFLGVVYMREADYDTAWFAAKTAQSLGYESQDLINVLCILSEEPHRLSSKDSEKSMYIGHIAVDTPEQAESLLRQHSKANLFIRIYDYKSTEQDTDSKVFNRIYDYESTKQQAAFKVFIGYIDASNVHPKIARALLNQEVFGDPVIVEADSRFHIVQRIKPLSPYFKQ